MPRNFAHRIRRRKSAQLTFTVFYLVFFHSLGTSFSGEMNMRAANPLERGPLLQLLIRLTCTLFDTKPLCWIFSKHFHFRF